MSEAWKGNKIKFCGQCNMVIEPVKNLSLEENAYRHFEEAHIYSGDSYKIYHPDDDWPEFESEWIYDMLKLDIVCSGCHKPISLLWGECDSKPDGYIICVCGKVTEIPYQKL